MKTFSILLVILSITLPSRKVYGKVLSQIENEFTYQLVIRLQRGKYISIDLDKKNNEVKHVKFFARKIRRKFSHRNKKYIKNMSKIKNQSPQFYKAMNMLTYLPTKYFFKNRDIVSKSSIKRFSNICHLKGKEQMSSYTFKRKVFSESITVGQKSNGCMGLCGKNCNNTLGKDIYTQECLDHDLCHRRTKSFLGCFDELSKAVHGFFFGNTCSSS